MQGGFGITIDKSRCLRHRYNKSSCSRCMDACRTGAISFASALALDDKTCTGCMLCVSSCPSEALAIKGHSLQRTVAQLAKASVPVLSCSRMAGLLAHAKGPCLGFLSLQHLLSIPAILGRTVRLNMTQCAQCENRHAAQRLEAMNPSHSAVEMVYSAAALGYQDIQTSRRDFFRMLCGTAVQAAQEYRDFSIEGMPQSGFSGKAIPEWLQIFNVASQKCSDAALRREIENSYAQMTIGDSCNNCMACAAMCPTGALSRLPSIQGLLRFDKRACTSCALCEEFCPSRAISLGTVREAVLA